MTQIVGLTAAWHQGKIEGDPVGTNIAGSPKGNKKTVHAEFNFFLWDVIKQKKIFSFQITGQGKQQNLNMKLRKPY